MRPRSPKPILRASRVPAFLVSNLTNIYYLTGVQVSAGLVLVSGSTVTLFTDSRYKEAAAKECYPSIIVKDLSDLSKSLSKIRRIGFEAEDVTCERFSQWKRKLKNKKFVQKIGIIEEFRRAKDEQERRKFRRAQRITRQIMKRIPGLLKGGISERELAWKMECFARELGAESLSFEPIVAFGTHTSRPHHHPTSRKLKKGDLVQIDCGARYKGYCADQSRVFFTSDPTDEQRRVFQAVKRAKREAEKLLKPGAVNRTIDRAARAVLKKEGLEELFVHSLGHGVGLEIHEGISLSKNAKKQTLKKHEIVTVEPGVYLPGKFGMRVEDEVIVG